MDERRFYSDLIKTEALKLGFSNIGFSKIHKLRKEGIILKKWLSDGNNAGMAYMGNHFDKRTDPEMLVPGAKSVVSLSYNYYTNKHLENTKYKISKYAYGRDYHKVLKNKLKQLFLILKNNDLAIQGRYFVDSAPVLERSLAQKAGIGWIGKNTMLIDPKVGSYFFIAEMILNIELEYNNKIIENHCGKCRRCIEACPTGALDENGYILNSNKCISYLTIENKGEISSEFKIKMNDYIFGCDICQEVCPWNRFSIPHNEQEFNLSNELSNISDSELEYIDLENFERLFENSAIKRCKLEGLKRNIDFIKSK